MDTETTTTTNMPNPANQESTFIRRNTWSFENLWSNKFKKADKVDLHVDDTDTWSLASYDSACDSDMDTQPYHHRSFQGISHRSSLKDLSTSDNMEHTTSPQSTPGLSRKIGTSANDLPVSDLGISNTDQLKEKQRSGLSNSMILNWLAFKKYQQYPTIVEGSERESPVDESTMDSGITVLPGPGTASTNPAASVNPATVAPKPDGAVNTSGKIFEAASSFTSSAVNPSPPGGGLKRNFSLNEVGNAANENVGIKRNFSFKELNSLAPSCW